ncbi:hypothetical protein KQX54_006729 [Cotesia glomerata]|uniref:Uncharacterized protein n=1 Tax=Cotesia glomerata TaxID=32391 RepID=A0AAV7IA89_COTGL|nr:hypothetical protein KQX54_006729 [Cotesia glomerata]
MEGNDRICVDQLFSLIQSSEYKSLRMCHRMQINHIFIFTLLLFLLSLAMTDTNNNNNNSSNNSKTELELPTEVLTKKFIPFNEHIETVESTIINVPVRCPPSMVKVGKRCRTIF